MSLVVFEVPPLTEQPYRFRQALLGAIRSAISEARIAGEISTPLAVECLRALPMPEDPPP